MIYQILLTTQLIFLRLSVDKSVATKGENLHYISTITNTGTLLKTNLLFSDVIPANTTFVENSVKIDNVQQLGYNPETGFSLLNLAVDASVVVEFDVTVN